MWRMNSEGHCTEWVHINCAKKNLVGELHLKKNLIAVLSNYFIVEKVIVDL